VYDVGAEINPGIALQLRYYFKPQKISTPLSKRETEVLQLLADGVNYKMITDKLFLSFTTVNTHVITIEDKCAMNEIPYEKAEQQINRYQTNIAQLNCEIAELKSQETNYMKYIKFGTTLLSNIDVYFKEAKFENRLRILSSIFPEKMIFENDKYRTVRENEFLAQMSNVYKVLNNTGNEKVGNNADLSNFALPVGLEPTTL
jgi:hypothetical protein